MKIIYVLHRDDSSYGRKGVQKLCASVMENTSFSYIEAMTRSAIVLRYDNKYISKLAYMNKTYI